MSDGLVRPFTGSSGQCHRVRGRSYSRFAALSAFVVTLLGSSSTPAHAAGTFYVDTQHPSASNANPGTEALPYKTISGAAAIRKGPGTTIIVKPGVYREQVTVPASGALNDPYVFQAYAPGVIVDGADDLSGSSNWALHSGTVYRAESVNWATLQVYVDGVRLQPSTVAPESLAVNSFVHVNGAAGGLFVNLGGANPGDHLTIVGRRAHGFRLSARSYVTVEGFTVRHTEDRGIYVLNGATGDVIRSNTVTNAYRYGIALAGVTGITVEQNVVSQSQDHGIALTDTTTASIVRNNESSNNAHPTIRQANGIYLNRSMNNLIQGNRLHHNQDSGLQQNSFSEGNRSIQNISWSNGDHGYDILNSANTTIIGCVAYGNYKNGFSIEGSSPGASLYNCIAVDNGINVLPADGLLETDLWVDAQSAVGFQSDYNIFWNSTSQAPVKYILTSYTSVAAYSAASGHDAHSLQLNPGFVDPANGNFELLPSSPAIDAANSGVAEWPALDALGRARIDAPAVANTGVGGIAFADRGALEFQTNQAPVVTAQPTAAVDEGAALSFNVTVADPDGDAIATLEATGLPAGASFTPGPGNTSGTLSWTPGFDQAGTYPIAFTATNAFSGSATTTITVNNVDRAPVVTAQATASVDEGAALSFSVTASDPDGDAITSLGATGLPAGATFTPGPGDTSGTLDWTPGFDQAGSVPITFTAANALSGSAVTTVTVNHVDLAPVVTAQPTTTVDEGVALSFNVTAADPDGDAITSLVATDLPLGATFTPGPGNSSGTLDWTPGFDQAGAYPITFTAANALSGSAGTTITVNHVDRAPVVSAQATASVDEGALLSFGVTAADPDGEPITSLIATDLPPWATFTPGPGNTSGTLDMAPGYSDAGEFTVTFTAANALSGSASTTITVNNVDRAPVVTAQPTASADEGVALSFNVAATDPDGEPISSFAATDLPAGASFTPGPDNTTGTLDWIPGFDQSGSHTVTFTATNALSGSASTTIEVAHVDVAPVVTAQATASVDEATLLSFGVTAADPDGEPITSLIATDLPPWATFTPGPGNTSGTLDMAPGYSDAGEFTVTFTAANALSGSASTTITVNNVDRAPVVTAQPTASADEGVALSFNVAATDPDGEPISSFAATDLPAGASFTPGPGNTTGTLDWIPGFDQSGSHTVTFTATNALSGSASTTIEVAHVDVAPVVTAQATASVDEATLLSFGVTAADPDGEPITSLIATNLPPWATFTPGPDNTSGTLDVAPGYSDAGDFTVTFTAANALSGSASTTITVNNVDRAPIVAVPPTVSGDEGVPLSISFSATDPDGDPITSVTATDLPAGATFTPPGDGSSGTFDWTPGFSQSGTYTVTITATNALSGSASTTITVVDVDKAPIVTAQPTATAAEGVALSFNVTATDPDGEAITSLVATDLPSGATFTPGPDNTTGTLDWTPGFDQAGSFTVTFTATNLLAGSASTTITVNNVDRAPVVTAPPTVSVNEGVLLSVIVSASDPDGEPIGSLTATNLPPGATFTPGPDNTTGTFEWTPGFDQACHVLVTFTASNGLPSSAVSAITVANVDRAPVVTVQPTVSVDEGVPLSLDVTVADPDGDGIGLILHTSLPPGGTFTPGPGNTSGTFAWTPAFGQSGEHVVTFTAVNSLLGSASTTITVGDVDRAPVVTAPPTASVDEGVLLSFQVSAGDPDGEPITSLEATELPPGASFTHVPGTTTGTFNWTPEFGQSGEFTVTFTAANALSGSASTTITVGHVDRAPVVASQANATVGEGAPLSFNVTATDPDGDAIVSLVATDLPEGATFTALPDNTSGTFAWTPAFGQAGSFTVTFTATNSLSGSANTTIVVGNVDRAPVVTVQPTLSVNDGALITLAVTASDPDGEPIISLVPTNLPDGATFTPGPDNTTGTFSWTPTPDQVGNHDVTFTATNALSGSATTTITVNAVTGVGPVAGIPARPILSPSPMRSRSTLSFYMASAGPLEVSIHDVTGRCVRRVVGQSDAPAGVHQLAIDGRGDTGETLSSGVYFYQIRMRNEVKTGRMVIAR